LYSSIEKYHVTVEKCTLMCTLQSTLKTRLSSTTKRFVSRLRTKLCCVPQSECHSKKCTLTCELQSSLKTRLNSTTKSFVSRLRTKPCCVKSESGCHANSSVVSSRTQCTGRPGRKLFTLLPALGFALCV